MVDHKLKYLKQLQKKNREIGYEGGGFFVTNIPVSTDLGSGDMLDYNVMSGGGKGVKNRKINRGIGKQVLVLEGKAADGLPPLVIGGNKL